MAAPNPPCSCHPWSIVVWISAILLFLFVAAVVVFSIVGLVKYEHDKGHFLPEKMTWYTLHGTYTSDALTLEITPSLFSSSYVANGTYHISYDYSGLLTVIPNPLRQRPTHDKGVFVIDPTFSHLAWLSVDSDNSHLSDRSYYNAYTIQSFTSTSLQALVNPIPGSNLPFLNIPNVTIQVKSQDDSKNTLVLLSKGNNPFLPYSFQTQLIWDAASTSAALLPMYESFLDPNVSTSDTQES